MSVERHVIVLSGDAALRDEVFYSAKAARGGNVKRVIQAALRMETGRASLGRARPPPGDGPTDGA